MSDGIRCPKCDAETTVVETQQLAGQIARRRRCSKRCGGYVHTVEANRDMAEMPRLRRALAVALDIIARYRRAAGAAPASQDVDALVDGARDLIGGGR